MTAATILLWAMFSAAGTTPATVVERVEAEYPAWANGTGLATNVSLRVRVSAQGRPDRIEVVPYSTKKDVLGATLRASFDSAAVRAVRKWRFRAAMQDGRRVTQWIQVDVPIEEAWTRSGDTPGVIPDSIQSSAHWKALMGEWLRGSGAPIGHPQALQFRRGGWYLARNAAGNGSQGRFELSSNGSLDDSAAMLVLVPDAGGRRRYSIRFAARDTLILSPWRTIGPSDTFTAAARAR